MEITKDTIKHVATLSRLAFNEEELDKFTDQMRSMEKDADLAQKILSGHCLWNCGYPGVGNRLLVIR